MGFCRGAGMRHPLHPSGSVAATRRFCVPPLTVIPTGGPKARSGGTGSNSPSTRHRTPCRNCISGIAARCSRTDSSASRCYATLRTASLGMTMMGPPGLQRAGWHVLAMQGGVRRPMATLCVAMPPTRRTPHDHGQDEQHARAGQATENHRDHRTDLGHPGWLCALGALCGKPHGRPPRPPHVPPNRTRRRDAREKRAD